MIKIIDPTSNVETVARSMAHIMGQEFDDLSFEDQTRYRALAFVSFDNAMSVRQKAIEECASRVEDLLSAHSTPKRWLPGIKEAANTLRVRLAFERDEISVGSTIPDRLPDNFFDDDPYEDIEAGDLDPEPLLPYEERCNSIHAGDWECTRAPHPPTWKHWDADREYCPSVSGQVIAIWRDSEDEPELAPDFLSIIGGDEDLD